DQRSRRGPRRRRTSRTINGAATTQEHEGEEQREDLPFQATRHRVHPSGDVVALVAFVEIGKQFHGSAFEKRNERNNVPTSCTNTPRRSALAETATAPSSMRQDPRSRRRAARRAARCVRWP